MGSRYAIYRQDVWDNEEAPGGPDWVPFAATCSVEHNGIRESLGGRLEVCGEVIWWRQEVSTEVDEVDDAS